MLSCEEGGLRLARRRVDLGGEDLRPPSQPGLTEAEVGDVGLGFVVRRTGTLPDRALMTHGMAFGGHCGPVRQAVAEHEAIVGGHKDVFTDESERRLRCGARAVHAELAEGEPVLALLNVQRDQVRVVVDDDRGVRAPTEHRRRRSKELRAARDGKHARHGRRRRARPSRAAGRARPRALEEVASARNKEQAIAVGGGADNRRHTGKAMEGEGLRRLRTAQGRGGSEASRSQRGDAAAVATSEELGFEKAGPRYASRCGGDQLNVVGGGQGAEEILQGCCDNRRGRSTSLGCRRQPAIEVRRLGMALLLVPRHLLGQPRHRARRPRKTNRRAQLMGALRQAGHGRPRPMGCCDEGLLANGHIDNAAEDEEAPTHWQRRSNGAGEPPWLCLVGA
mmetsp:Transcript_67187/g.194501  ORF Transcript_67187/g.194501 Transcript_67187/m.194501 type:complete len:393 (-) Transcript_67187:194-1372(-)